MIVLHFPYRIMVCFHDGFVAKSTLLVKATVCCHQVVPLDKKKKKEKKNWALTLRTVSKSDLTLQLPVALLAIPLSPSIEMGRVGEARNDSTHYRACLLST